MKERITKIREWIYHRKGYCLGAVILVIFLAVVCSQMKIETVSEYNAREKQSASERQSILAELEEEEETPISAVHDVTEHEENETTTEQMVVSQEESDSTSMQKESGTTLPQIESENQSQTSVTEQEVPQSTTQRTEHITTKKEEHKETTTETDEIKKETTTKKQEETKDIVVSITISCDAVLQNPDLNTSAQIPENGIFLNAKTVVKKGETVLQALENACKDYGISYVKEGSSYGFYISSIGGLAEQECGKYSGWKYKVNGEIGSTSCSSYVLEENDEIVWYYATHYLD